MNKKYIIKSNEEIEKIIKLGIKMVSNYFVIYYIENKTEYSRFAVSVGKKVGNAVVRNYIRRQIKDILMKNMLCINKDYVIIIRNSILSLSYTEKEKELITMIKGEKHD